MSERRKACATAEKTEIELSILAYDPLIYVVTLEEERFLKEMERICMHRRRKLWVHIYSYRRLHYFLYLCRRDLEGTSAWLPAAAVERPRGASPKFA